jgi:hypothetical protein
VKELVLVGLTFGSQGYVSASAVCHLELSKLMIDAQAAAASSHSRLFLLFGLQFLLVEA